MVTGADQTDITGRCDECGHDAPGLFVTRDGVTRCYVCEHEDTCVEPECGWCRTSDCTHDWTLRPESDTWVCEICGGER